MNRLQNLIKYQFSFNNKNLEMLGRAEIQSDHDIISNVFQSMMFSTERFPTHHKALQNCHSDFISRGKTPAIIDAGANIGAASLYFSECYSDSKLYSIEPDSDNFTILSNNMKNRNYSGLHGALSSEDGTTFLNTRDYQPIGFRTSKTGDTQVHAYSLSTIINNLPSSEPPFILKIDIEGAEADVFREEIPLLGRIPLIIIEPHDWMLPFEGSSRNFMAQISKNNFDILFYGENLFFFNNTIMSIYR